MTFEQTVSLIQTASLLIGIVVAVGTLRNRGDDKTVALTKMQVDIGYIKEKIEGIEDIRDIATDARASAKSAHRRLDEHLRYDHHNANPNHEN